MLFTDEFIESAYSAIMILFSLITALARIFLAVDVLTA